VVSGWAELMDVQRRMRLWSLVVEQSRGRPVTIEHVCAVVVAAAGVDGVAVTVAVAASPRETLCASDPVVSEVEELALMLGEGPSVEAMESGPVLVADLAAPDCGLRWPMYTPAAMQAGVRAVFALPLRVGAIRLGVMDLYRTEPGGLDREQLADALLLADTACAILLDAGRHYPSRVNGSGPAQTGLQHPEVHQATGMLIVQLGVSAAVALIRLRAYAYAHDRRLRDVAADIVARRLRLHPEPAAEDGDAG
jgi:GAF domain-containing protein